VPDLITLLQKLVVRALLVGFACLGVTTAGIADSTSAECGFSTAVDTPPQQTTPCQFSQRQGYIGIYFDDGREFNFSPQGDQPGNYRDDDGNAIYRKRGLGEDGQLFQLPGQFLFVYWQPQQWRCSEQELSTPGGCELSLVPRLSFALVATTGSSLNRLTITPAALETDNAPIVTELDGTAYGAEIADLDANGWPEVYVYVSSAGSGSYGSLVAYAVNSGKSMSAIHLPELSGPGVIEGYAGHDEFSIVESRLVRRFPVYLPADTNAAPSGGTRQVSYRLEPGEAGWLLVPDRVDNF